MSFVTGPSANATRGRLRPNLTPASVVPSAAMTRERWRYVDLGAVGPAEAMSQNPVLAGDARKQGRPVAQTSVWGRTHLNVGWFDDIDAVLDLAACRRAGVEVIRRPVYGGGTAFYQEGCAVMWSFFLPEEDGTLDEKLARFQPVLLDALSRIGLEEVGYEGSSDLRWHGRKLGALTAQDVGAAHSVGGFLNVARPDLDLYLEVVRVPDDKFRDKVVKDMREYVCTAEEVAGRAVGYEEFRDAVVSALEAFGVDLDHQPLTEEERESVDGIADYLGGDEQVEKISSARFEAEAPDGARVGFGNEKGKKLCRAGVALDEEGRVVASMMAGDMHVSPPDTLERVAEALIGAGAGDDADLRARIASVFEGDDVTQADTAVGVTTDDLLAAVRKAVEAAQPTRRSRS